MIVVCNSVHSFVTMICNHDIIIMCVVCNSSVFCFLFLCPFVVVFLYCVVFFFQLCILLCVSCAFLQFFAHA